MRLIVTSRTYQHSSQTNSSNPHDRINYSHALPRPLEPAVLLDAISQVTGVPEVFGKMPVGTRAIELRFPKESSFLDIFGTPQRDVVPEPGGKPSLGQALHMFAGATFNQKLSKEDGFLAADCTERPQQSGNHRTTAPGDSGALSDSWRTGRT